MAFASFALSCPYIIFSEAPYDKRFLKSEFKIKDKLDAISHATCGMAIDIDAKAIVVSSMSGMTVRMVSRFRSPTDIIGMATTKEVWYNNNSNVFNLDMLGDNLNSIMSSKLQIQVAFSDLNLSHRFIRFEIAKTNKNYNTKCKE